METSSTSISRSSVVGGITIPKGVAYADERATELAAGSEAFEVGMGRGEAHLEHATGVATGAKFGFADLIKFGQGAAEWFFAQDPGSGFHGRDAHAGMATGRGGDEHDIRTDGFQHFVEVGEGLRDVSAFTEGIDEVLVQVHGRD